MIATATATIKPMSRPPRNVRMINLSPMSETQQSRQKRGLQLRLLPHHDLGAHGHSVIEVGDIGVDEAEAARRHFRADRIRAVGAMNAIDRGAEIHRPRAERVTRTACHEARQIGLALDHLRWWHPVRPFGLAADVQKPLPLKTIAADADAVSKGAAAG